MGNNAGGDNSIALDQIAAQKDAPVKTHSEYDGSNRLQYLYSAPESAENGDPALKTVFTYDGATSRIVGTKEIAATWNSSWDI